MEFGLSLGSNLGDRLANLRQARDRLAAIPGCTIRKCSPVYETEPVDVRPEHRGQPFLNAILILNSQLAPAVLADRLLAIETAMGRNRGAKRNEPRIVDIDMIYAGALRIETPTLTVPHPRWAARRFVVQPLADVRPDVLLPGADRTVGQVLATLPQEPSVRLYLLTW